MEINKKGGMRRITSKEEAGEDSLSSDFHSRSIWWTCSSRTATSAVRLSLRADWRSLNIPWRSSTRFLALSLKSWWDADRHPVFDPFPMAPPPHKFLT